MTMKCKKSAKKNMKYYFRMPRLIGWKVTSQIFHIIIFPPTNTIVHVIKRKLKYLLILKPTK